MLQESSRPVTAHKLEMQNRNHVDLTGITEVISFDNKEIELETCLLYTSDAADD